MNEIPKPEVVTLSGTEFAIYNAAQRQGQAEALTDVAGNLHRAIETYRAQIAALPGDVDKEQLRATLDGLVGAFAMINESFKAKGAESRKIAQVELARACAMLHAKDNRPPRLSWWRRLLARAALGHRARLVLDSPHASPPR